VSESDSVVHTERDARDVLTITLDRAGAANAMNDAMVEQLTAVLGAVAGDESIRVVVLTGSGRTFCAGGDISAMSAMSTWTRQQNLADSERFDGLFRMLDECPHPVVCRVNGSAFGGGVGLVACADVAVAVDTASFALSEVRIGIIPAVVSTYVVPKLGVSWSRRMMLTGERITATQALTLGLVHEVVHAEELASRTAAVVDALLASDVRAQRRIKQHIIGSWQGTDAGRERIAAAAVEAATAARMSPEGAAGMSTFLDRSTRREQH